MAVSKAMLKRGKAVGLEPTDGESGNAFGARVRKAEAAAKESAPAPAAKPSTGGWRRF